MVDLNVRIVTQEQGGKLRERGNIARSIKVYMARTLLCTRKTLLHLGMPLQIIAQTVAHRFALRHKDDLGVIEFLEHTLYDAGNERIVGAAKNDGVDIRIALEQLAQIGPDLLVELRAEELSALDDRHPLRTSLRGETQLRRQLGQLKIVALTAHGGTGSHQADVTAIRELSHTLDSRTDHAQHTAGGIVALGQFKLLYGAQSLGRGGVAGQDYQRAAHREQPVYRLIGELEDLLERAIAIGGTAIIAQEDIVVLGQEMAYFAEDGQTTETAVENTYRLLVLRRFHAAKIGRNWQMRRGKFINNAKLR